MFQFLKPKPKAPSPPLVLGDGQYVCTPEQDAALTRVGVPGVLSTAPCGTSIRTSPTLMVKLADLWAKVQSVKGKPMTLVEAMLELGSKDAPARLAAADNTPAELAAQRQNCNEMLQGFLNHVGAWGQASSPTCYVLAAITTGPDPRSVLHTTLSSGGNGFSILAVCLQLANALRHQASGSIAEAGDMAYQLFLGAARAEGMPVDEILAHHVLEMDPEPRGTTPASGLN